MGQGEIPKGSVHKEKCYIGRIVRKRRGGDGGARVYKVAVKCHGSVGKKILVLANFPYFWEKIVNFSHFSKIIA